MVMCGQPTILAPQSSREAPNSSRKAISPGISVSAIAISRRDGRRVRLARLCGFGSGHFWSGLPEKSQPAHEADLVEADGRQRFRPAKWLQSDLDALEWAMYSVGEPLPEYPERQVKILTESPFQGEHDGPRPSIGQFTEAGRLYM
jgi:hypothetical protein